jgi:hypothetical protein
MTAGQVWAGVDVGKERHVMASHPVPFAQRRSKLSRELAV